MKSLKIILYAMAIIPFLLSCGNGHLPSASGAGAEVILENDWMYYGKGPHKLRVALSCRDSTDCKAAVSMLLMTDMKDTVADVTRYGIFKGGKADTVSFSLPIGPGFYRVEVSVDDTAGGRIPVKAFNIGCDPEKIVSPQDRMADFSDFWEGNLAQLAEVEPQYVLTLLPEHSGKLRNVYRVDMKSFGGEDISGIYVEPVAPGKYPAYITYMGYNSDPWYPDADSNPDVVEFTLSIREQALNKIGEKTGWVTKGIGDKDTYYYRGAFLDVVRAVDFVCSREKADTSAVFAEGGSQGGALTIVAAALDGRIKAIAPFVPFLSDFPDYFTIAPWPANEVLPAADSLGLDDDELYRTLSYFDVKNFADRISCPVLMGFGLQDGVCPPHTNFAGYNLMNTEKQYICFPEAGHQVEKESGWWKARNEFFGNMLKKNN